jgi:uncharacterized protein HemY
VLAAAAATGGDLTRANTLLALAEQRAVDRTAVDLQRARLNAAAGDLAGALSQCES